MNKKIQRMPRYLILAVVILASLPWLYRNSVTVPDDVVFRLIDGRQLTLEQLRGRPVLIDFWATSCRSCLEETPDLIALYQELANQGLEIIAVAMPYDRPDMVLKAAEELNIPYPIALDIDGTVVAAFGGIAVTPTHFLIRPDGKIADRITGTIDPAKLRVRIKKMLPQEIFQDA